MHRVSAHVRPPERGAPQPTCASTFSRLPFILSLAAEFIAFQRLFLGVYLTMVMSDWLQGPYVYRLYAEYGFTKGDIGLLFIAGFGSSLVFGTVVGGFADRYGRKLNCLLFALLYGISCITKHFNSFTILMIGRLLGGVATSILMSAFETWMIHEHRSRNFGEEWLSSTFSAMTFGGGIVAIAAGIVAYLLAATFGSVAPFDASLVLLVIGAAVIWTRWKENYGESSSHSSAGSGSAGSSSALTSSLPSAFDSFKKTAQLLLTNEKVLLLGLIQSCFEGSMYIFVFMWTPALEDSLKATVFGSKDGPATIVQQGDASSAATAAAQEEAASLPHGIIFALFMVAIMIGSKLFESLIANRTVEHFLRWVFVAASISLAIPIVTQNHNMQLLAFCVFEVCCGIYFPSAGTLRSKYIPEEVRSTVMNVFRVGLNLLVVLTLINIESLAQDTVFLLTVLLLTLAVLCQQRLFALSEQNSTPAERTRAGLAPGEEVDEVLSSKADASA
jgi:MFS transporter, MFS domain-containing protein family, molybdate-anion transporter